MPIFEFECRKCGHQFEELVLSTSRNGVSCPQCKGKRLSKLMSTFAGRVAGKKDYDLKPVAGSKSCSGCSATSCASCK